MVPTGMVGEPTSLLLKQRGQPLPPQALGVAVCEEAERPALGGGGAGSRAVWRTLKGTTECREEWRPVMWNVGSQERPGRGCSRR